MQENDVDTDVGAPDGTPATGTYPGAGAPAGRGRRAVLAGLCALVLGLTLAVGVVAWRSDEPAAALRSAAGIGGDDLGAQHREVAGVAREVTLAFLAVDHEDMGPLMDKVVALATGDFKKQYEASRAELEKQAVANKSVSTGSVEAVGVGELDSDSATVYVAANSEVRNTSTQGSSQPRYYRLQIDLVKEKGRWLASQVQFVG